MKKKEGTNDSIEKNRRSRSVNRLSSQVDRNDEKKRERKAQCTDTIVPDTFPVISRSIVCATQVERYKNSTVCSPGRQCASFSPDRVREIEQNCWSQWSSFSFRV